MDVDGRIAEAAAIFEGRHPLAEITHDLHLLEIIEAAAASAKKDDGRLRHLALPRA